MLLPITSNNCISIYYSENRATESSWSFVLNPVFFSLSFICMKLRPVRLFPISSDSALSIKVHMRFSCLVYSLYEPQNVTTRAGRFLSTTSILKRRDEMRKIQESRFKIYWHKQTCSSPNHCGGNVQSYKMQKSMGKRTFMQCV